jgi:uncharacterized RDD family membrane protein YckC
MVNQHTDTSLGFGVYFAPEDYVGFGPRLVIFAIDGLVLLGSLWLLQILWEGAVGRAWGLFALLAALSVWLYIVPLKRSPIRTVGYRLINCRLVTLDGKPPSLFMMTFRSLFWVFGPGNLILDFIWCGIDQDRQTLRDRYAGACLVKNGANPVGEGPIHLAYYDAMGYNLMLAHVVHSSPDDNSECED